MNRQLAIARALGQDPAAVRIQPVSGGCINQAAIVSWPGGQAFAKWNERPLPGQFAAEAAGLDALAAAASGLRIPCVIAHSDNAGAAYLLLEHLPLAARAADFDQALGRGLAVLHGHSDARGFGFPLDGYCGATPQPNGWRDHWPVFYAEMRLGHQLRLCAEKGLPAQTLRRIETLLGTLPERVGEPEPPALIHGDLWSGNLHTAPDGGPALIDPAAYFGQREAELGMMVLFGGFGERVFAAYQEVWPLQPGWRERLPIYALYHVLNHYVLFGGGYAAQADQILRKLV